VNTFGRIVTRVQIGERLSIGVADDVAAGDRLGAPWRREIGAIRLSCADYPPMILRPAAVIFTTNSF
jgi:hypothetical protein